MDNPDVLVAQIGQCIPLQGAILEKGEPEDVFAKRVYKVALERTFFDVTTRVLLAVEVALANRHDMKLVAATLVNMRCACLVAGRKSKLCLDLGHDYDEVQRTVHLAGFEPVILSRRDEQKNKKQPGARARRWVVERAHSWLNRFRRLLVR